MSELILPAYGRSLQGSAPRIKMLAHRGEWVREARPNQLPPAGDSWDIWLSLAGRGFGKTRLGAEAIAWESWQQPETISHVAAATHGDLRSVCYEGESGLLAQIPPECIKPNGYNRSLAEIYLTNGSIIRGFSAEAPDRARGPQCHRMWGDELAAWDQNRGNAQAMFDMMMMGLRLGQHSYAILTTTPKPIMLIKNLVDLSRGKITSDNKLLKDLRVVLTRGKTDENFQNLSRNFQTIISQYRGTRLGRQELDAEILDDMPGALWNGTVIDTLRIGEAELPEMVRIVVSIDPAVSTNEKSNETGIVVVGIGEDDHGYLLKDASANYSPMEWAQEAIKLYKYYEADCIIGEVNNGGDLIESNIRGVDPNVAYKAVRASRGKVRRAEPVAALYEQGKVHHVGNYDRLEDQLCSLTVDFDPRKAGYSPDRADALVWGITELMLGEMDSFGVYEYYRKRVAEETLAKSTKNQTVAKNMVLLHRGTSGISTVYGMQGNKFDVDGEGHVVVPKELVANLMASGFTRVGV